MAQAFIEANLVCPLRRPCKAARSRDAERRTVRIESTPHQTLERVRVSVAYQVWVSPTNSRGSCGVAGAARMVTRPPATHCTEGGRRCNGASG